MRIVALVALTLALAACQSGAPRGSNQPILRAEPGTQSVAVKASPEQVRQTLKTSAAQKGTLVVQDDPNMVIIENVMRQANPVLDQEFGPSDNGDRVIRVRVRFSGSQCNTLVVQDVALLNNAHTGLEQSYKLPGDNNTMQSLIGLKQNAEATSQCI
ncbi:MULTISPECIES: hypothetical protein [Pseudovibrio]|uniref:hypothetical protein n=1 Tax=Stappiaceae TaxID=2821832 RepID=UPI002365A35A|nr:MULTISPECIES: hypothetical protein [Pseudovibrio]MDD7910455.1 hypothetical protein [Pseudovibrio exalbescens]MDX5594170.1 hypothetical protein [Pseudovibrio sp. SPO723]